MAISWEDFEKVDMRIGRVVKAEPLPGAEKPAYRLEIDFGPLGVKKSSARITELYGPQQLVGKQVVCVVNFPPKKIAGFDSEVLVMGVYDRKGVVLLAPERECDLGTRIG
jgi:tRNA-binding protein